MVNWIAGHTNRFKALVSHAGPFNLENMATATEELWFPDWEYGGPFWDPKAMASQYRVYSPHLFVKNFKTPTLVTGGELDYRVPYTEDLSMFTSLQRMNVPSRLVIFPDEGHWIGKPQNQQLWWGEVQSWLSKYPGAPDPRHSGGLTARLPRRLTCPTGPPETAGSARTGASRTDGKLPNWRSDRLVSAAAPLASFGRSGVR